MITLTNAITCPNVKNILRHAEHIPILTHNREASWISTSLKKHEEGKVSCDILAIGHKSAVNNIFLGILHLALFCKVYTF